jgi:predicted nucleotidyltransferase
VTQVFQATGEVQRWLEDRGWRFCFICGVALQVWGAPRQTNDVDLTLLTGFGNEEAVVDGLLTEFTLRRDLGREMALRSRVFLGKTRQGVGVDVALGALPFEERTVERSRVMMLSDGASIRVCCAEDLVVHKVFAGRDRDWTDIEGILARQWGRLNLALIAEELRPLLELKETPESLDRLNALVALTDRRLRNAQRQFGRS